MTIQGTAWHHASWGMECHHLRYWVHLSQFGCFRCTGANITQLQGRHHHTHGSLQLAWPPYASYHHLLHSFTQRHQIGPHSLSPFVLPIMLRMKQQNSLSIWFVPDMYTILQLCGSAAQQLTAIFVPYKEYALVAHIPAPKTNWSAAYSTRLLFHRITLPHERFFI